MVLYTVFGEPRFKWKNCFYKKKPIVVDRHIRTCQTDRTFLKDTRFNFKIKFCGRIHLI